MWKTKTAPTREGYVFGGWYTNNEGTMTAIKESNGGQVDAADAYAKFVPAEVLSVRTQLEVETETKNGNTDKTYLRLLSAVNGLDYQETGFDIWYNKTIEEKEAPAITKVYKTIKNSETKNEETGEEESISASSIFGDAATHFSVLRVADIYSVNYQLVIYVRPHWTTLDGTTVYGQAKYVRVMDGYKDHHYISVPVNFLTGSAVAAGQLEMSYDSRLEVVAVDGVVDGYGFDEGMLMTEMSYYNNNTDTSDTTDTIRIVGNIAGTKDVEPKDVEPEQDIYANVWFKVKSDQTVEDGEVLEFKMSNLSFCNWNEDMVTNIKAWNVQY